MKFLVRGYDTLGGESDDPDYEPYERSYRAEATALGGLRKARTIGFDVVQLLRVEGAAPVIIDQYVFGRQSGNLNQ